MKIDCKNCLNLTHLLKKRSYWILMIFFLHLMQLIGEFDEILALKQKIQFGGWYLLDLMKKILNGCDFYHFTFIQYLFFNVDLLTPFFKHDKLHQYF